MDMRLRIRRPEGKRLPRRVSRAVNHLGLYSRIFSEITTGHGHGERIEIEIEHEPWNQLSTVRIHLPSSAVHSNNGRAELLKISRFPEEGHERLPVEITGMVLLAGLEKVETHRGPEATTIFVQPNQVKEVNGLQFEFVAWELVSPLRGHAPYLVATLAFVVELGAHVERLPMLVLLKTPRAVTPRSTQGNHIMAYPSRTTDAHRVLGVYFGAQRLVTLRYTSGGTEDLLRPWEGLGRSAVSAALVFLVTSSAATASSGDRFLALLAAFAAAAQVSWDAAREIAVLSIYGRNRRSIPAAVLGINAALLVTFILALLGLSGSALIPMATIRWFSLAIAVAAALAAGIGLLTHRSGALHGYLCDFLWCDRGLGLRRRRRAECGYTGRVFCDIHIQSVCAQCVHGEDLKGETLVTAEHYSAGSVLCVFRQDARSTKVSRSHASMEDV